MITRIRKVVATLIVAAIASAGVVSVDITPATAATGQPFYALLRSKTSATYSLAIVDPTTAVTTTVKQLDFSKVGGSQYNDLRSAGYDPVNGLFYAFENTYQQLFAINPQSGLVTYRGTFSPAVPGGITAMAIDSKGTGYAFGANNLIYEVWLRTAEVFNPKQVYGLKSTTQGIESMSFNGSTMYAYAERTDRSAFAAPVLGVTLKIENVNSAWQLTDFHYGTEGSGAGAGTMDAYGIVVQDNTYYINQLALGEHRLTSATPTAVNKEMYFGLGKVFVSESGQWVRGFYSTQPQTLTFDSNGGSSVPAVYGAAGTRMTEPATPTRSGASFEGWFTAPTGGTKITWPYTLTTSTTVYAQWNATPATLSFDSHGGSAKESISAFVGDEIAEPTPDPVLSNYGFDGWYTAATRGSQAAWPYPLDGDTTLHAVWSQIPAVLTLKTENGSSDITVSSFQGVEIDEPTAPTKTGASFAGWYTAQSGGTRVTWPYTLAAHTTLWAHWEATIEFVSAGGTPLDPVVSSLGSSIAQPTPPTYAHRIFSGWYTAAEGGTLISWPYALTQNTVMYAQWARIPATVTFDSHGGSSVNPVSTFEGELLTEPTEPTKTNAAFEGWFDKATGGTKVLWSHFVTGNTTFHAQWNTVPVTLSFDSQGGTTVAAIDTYAGEEIAMPADPTRSGYTFAGWFTSLRAEQSVMWPYEVTANEVLYARWTQNAPELDTELDTERNPEIELAATGSRDSNIRLAAAGLLLFSGSALIIWARRQTRHH